MPELIDKYSPEKYQNETELLSPLTATEIGSFIFCLSLFSFVICVMLRYRFGKSLDVLVDERRDLG